MNVFSFIQNYLKEIFREEESNKLIIHQNFQGKAFI